MPGAGYCGGKEAELKKEELILINPWASWPWLSVLQGFFATGKPIPYALLTLAALTPAGYKVKIINQKWFWRRRDFCAGALVGLTCMTAGAIDAYRLADRFRRAGSKVVLGGPHVSALPDEALEHADSIVIGEGESVWPRIIDDFENSRLQKIYRGEPLDDFFSPVCDYFLRLDPRILARSGIHIDRGCKYDCEFCARIPGKLRFIDMELVVRLITRISGARRGILRRSPEIVFRCDNIYSNPAYAKNLFRAMIPLGVAWGAASSIDIGFDNEALELARQSGCRTVLVGIESIYPQDNPKTSLKQIRSIADYRAAIKNIRARGIKVIGSFIIGLDHYSHADYAKLLWFLAGSGLWHWNLTILTPFPGSRLFEKLKNEKRIVSFDYRKYNLLMYTYVIKPHGVSTMSVYFWFYLIRIISIFVTPALLRIQIYSFLVYYAGHSISSAIAHHLRQYFLLRF